MQIAIHLRNVGRDSLYNATNVRANPLIRGFSNAGHKVTVVGREDTKSSDLHVQVGFALTSCLQAAMDRGEPFLIMEAPFIRGTNGWDVNEASSFGYNGLAGGALRPETPDTERWKPIVYPQSTSGATVIFGQKPTDHSLRGQDHAQWILDKMEQYPEAEFRHHPLMVPQDSQEPLRDVMGRCLRAITYTSCAGAEALLYGCISQPEGKGSPAYGVTDREKFAHDMSWCNFHHTDLATLPVVNHILSGYEEALEAANRGEYDKPRERVDGPAICQQYYQRLVR